MTSTYIICSLCGDSVTAEGYASVVLLTCDTCSDLGEGSAEGEVDHKREDQRDDDYDEFADLDHGARAR